MNLEELRLELAAAIRGSEFAGKTFFTGGCIRDRLLARPRPSLDLDLAVELPQGGIRLAQHLKRSDLIVIHQVFPAFGTAKATLGEAVLEFVMTRRERYQPGKRHPRVDFADLHQDALRRDFTVNALYQELLSGGIIDPCGQGQADLAERVIRSVRDPLSAFREDPLRILRALRFAAQLGFGIEPHTLSALSSVRDAVSGLSRKRCQDELARLALSGPDAEARFRELSRRTGVDGVLAARLG
jgi:poly(A) polymerase